jgi:maleylacetoacetate isomerase
MQPLQNSSVLAMVGEEKKLEWLDLFLKKGFKALEETLKITSGKNSKLHINYFKIIYLSGKYCVGDEITIADLCLAPQVLSAHRFNVSLDDFPNVRRINEELEKLPEFQMTHPDKQIDYR